MHPGRRILELLIKTDLDTVELSPKDFNQVWELITPEFKNQKKIDGFVTISILGGPLLICRMDPAGVRKGLANFSDISLADCLTE